MEYLLEAMNPQFAPIQQGEVEKSRLSRCRSSLVFFFFWVLRADKGELSNSSGREQRSSRRGMSARRPLVFALGVGRLVTKRTKRAFFVCKQTNLTAGTATFAAPCEYNMFVRMHFTPLFE
jgi:hypothetical protein